MSRPSAPTDGWPGAPASSTRCPAVLQLTTDDHLHDFPCATVDFGCIGASNRILRHERAASQGDKRPRPMVHVAERRQLSLSSLSFSLSSSDFLSSSLSSPVASSSVAQWLGETKTVQSPSSRPNFTTPLSTSHLVLSS